MIHFGVTTTTVEEATLSWFDNLLAAILYALLSKLLPGEIRVSNNQ
jgi:hypothetical protein